MVCVVSYYICNVAGCHNPCWVALFILLGVTVVLRGFDLHYIISCLLVIRLLLLAFVVYTLFGLFAWDGCFYVDCCLRL